MKNTAYVIFFRNDTLWSFLIRLVTFGRWHHCGLIDFEANTLIEARPFKGVVETPLDPRLDSIHDKFQVVPFPCVDSRMVSIRARSELGKGYDWLGLLGFRSKKRWYCSELVADALNMLPHVDAVPVISPQELYVLGLRLLSARGEYPFVQGAIPDPVRGTTIRI